MRCISSKCKAVCFTILLCSVILLSAGCGKEEEQIDYAQNYESVQLTEMLYWRDLQEIHLYMQQDFLI